jgi:hypothetical protein
LKCTDQHNKPYVQFNHDYWKRKMKSRKLAKYILFAVYDGWFKTAKNLVIIGFLPSADLERFPVNPDGRDRSPAFRIPKHALRTDFNVILKRL